MFDIEGKVAIITGGFGYLSYNFSRTLAENNVNLIVTDIDTKEQKERIKELKKLNDNDVLVYDLDITQKDDIEEIKDKVVSRYGRIDVLINAAQKKTENVYMPFEEFPLKDWEDIMKVDITGVFLCCQSIGKQMLEQKGGSIINIASIYGVVAPNPEIYVGSNLDEVYIGGKLKDKNNKNYRINSPGVYSVSKAGVIMLTKYLAAYWGYRNVRVNCITPGGVYHEKENKTFLEKYSKKTPLRRKAHPDEINGAIVFLASNASSYMTGHNLIVDGGWTIW